MTATVLTATGITFIVDKLDDATATGAWVLWGTGGSSTGATATDTDTGLAAAATEAAVAATKSQPDTQTNTYVATITAGSAKTIEEAIVLVGTGTATGSNRTLIRASHGGQTLATGDSIQYTFNLTATSA